MRLISVRTRQLEYFATPPELYAVLSHTWGKAEDEVSYQDFQDADLRGSKRGFAKIESTCERAKADGLSYVWIDTCCIDKSSSAELGEAINSMFTWYRLATVCYVYLEDVDSTAADQSIRDSRWLTRGWTLQELIAPRVAQFYDCHWRLIGDKNQLGDQLHDAAGIDTSILQGAALDTVCVGRRMRWAASRSTTREEDIAYCLMGIFDVNMAMLYGEGAVKAFQRLQEEIVKEYDDHTIFAWRANGDMPPSATRGMLAESPAEFASFQYIRPFRDLSEEDGNDSNVTLTNRGVRFTAKVSDVDFDMDAPVVYLSLNCLFDSSDEEKRVPVAVRLVSQGGRQYTRLDPSHFFPGSVFGKTKTVYVTKRLASNAFYSLPMGGGLKYAFFARKLPEIVGDGAVVITGGSMAPFAEPYIINLKEGTAERYSAFLALPLRGTNEVAQVFLAISRAHGGRNNRYCGEIGLLLKPGMFSVSDAQNPNVPMLPINNAQTLELQLPHKPDMIFQVRASLDTILGYDAFLLELVARKRDTCRARQARGGA
ncbi:hypothetical protein MFIFM68171_02043 [Madurella fahalii]|uniref:Heterokaryon incompatibility domain-containing protein n=1 Tax=Madurella fahalii TaxID=1157608 RepID=A0ABQ0G248_9PEZI